MFAVGCHFGYTRYQQILLTPIPTGGFIRYWGIGRRKDASAHPIHPTLGLVWGLRTA